MTTALTIIPPKMSGYMAFEARMFWQTSSEMRALLRSGQPANYPELQEDFAVMVDMTDWPTMRARYRAVAEELSGYLFAGRRA